MFPVCYCDLSFAVLDACRRICPSEVLPKHLIRFAKMVILAFIII
jgi:hypothetical protein